MVVLGRVNSRMKDFYDIWFLSRTYEFNDDRLARAIAATFARRATVIPEETPDALTEAFADDPAKQGQWTSFVETIEAETVSLDQVVGDVAAFLMAHAKAAQEIGE